MSSCDHAEIRALVELALREDIVFPAEEYWTTGWSLSGETSSKRPIRADSSVR